MRELKLKRCLKCNNLVEDTLNKEIICCGEVMQNVIPNENDASKEKHLPNYEVVGDKLIVSVNHVMEEEHFIEWLMVKGKNITIKKEFTPDDKPILEVPYEKDVFLYSYCNKHGLWMKKVS